MGNLSKKFMVLILGGVLFAATALISQWFNPYEDLIAAGGMSSLSSELGVQTRYVLSELYAMLETCSAIDGLEGLPAFQEFPLSNVLIIFWLGSFVAMVFFWHIFEKDFFDTECCDSFGERVMTWISHYFATFVVMYWISVISYEATMFLNWILCSLCRIHIALGVVFLIILAFPLLFLYVFCLVMAIQWIKYLIVCGIPILVLGYFELWDALFASDLETVIHQPLILLGLLAALLYERVCVELIVMKTD